MTKSVWDRDYDISLLEIFDLETDTRTVVAEFPYLIEAPNWSIDGDSLIFNSGGRIYRFPFVKENS